MYVRENKNLDAILKEQFLEFNYSAANEIGAQNAFLKGQFREMSYSAVNRIGHKMQS